MSSPAKAISTEILAPRLPVLGSVKIGGLDPKPRQSSGGGEWQRPVKYDHFQITTRERGPDGNFLRDDQVHAVIGDEPTELDVRLPFDTRAQNLYTRMLHYDGRTRARECDGETYLDPRTEVTGTCARRMGQSCDCKPYARLSVILEAAPTFGGVYVYRTTSWEATSSMQTVLRELERDLGSLRGLPMRMILTPAEVRYRHRGEEKTATAHKVALVLRASYEQAREAMLAFHEQNRLARSEVLRLAAGTEHELASIEDEDEEALGAEFFPRALPAGSAEGESPTKLAEINRGILGGPGTEESGEAVDVEQLAVEVRRLMKEAPSRGLALRSEHIDSLHTAIETRHESQLREGLGWLRRQLKKVQTTQTEQEG